MSDIVVTGLGAVSPAGWGVEALIDALRKGTALPSTTIQGPKADHPLALRRVPAPETRPGFLAQPRLRRSSPISHFCVAAAAEALGGIPSAPSESADTLRLGLVFCTMTGSVVYSRRFYEEVLREPVTASPLLFPETVYNAPASHLAAVLGIRGRVHTEVGDAGCLLKALATAALWLNLGVVDRCLVVASEEADWLVGEGLLLLSRTAVGAEGAAALVLARAGEVRGLARLDTISDAFPYGDQRPPDRAIAEARDQLDPTRWFEGGRRPLLVDGIGGGGRLERAERDAWRRWTGDRWSVKAVLGEAWTAGAGWQCAAAVAAVAHGDGGDGNADEGSRASTETTFDRAVVSVVGTQENAVAAVFTRCEELGGSE
ncbi:MAG: beta-ketoacyl synthase N-terminal-like domain-containing protein [Limisphaerales bacterium]